jgi:hypothetical protein
MRLNGLILFGFLEGLIIIGLAGLEAVRTLQSRNNGLPYFNAIIKELALNLFDAFLNFFLYILLTVI